MPEPRGRKKGRNHERRRDGGGTSGGPPRPIGEEAAASPKTVGTASSALVEPRMPSPFARATGALLAIITGVLAVYMVINGLSAESAGAGVVRVVAGVLLVLLAMVVGVLSVAPEVVRAMVWRWRGR